MVNTKRMFDRMRQLDITIDDLAIYMNKSVKSLSQIINNEKLMVLYEAYIIADYLQISAEEISEYFFFSGCDAEDSDEEVAV